MLQKRRSEAIEGGPFTLTFKEGDNLLNVMKAQLKIVSLAKDGFISLLTVCGTSPSRKQILQFIRRERYDEPVGAKEVILKAGDVIDWKLNKLQ